MLNSTVNSTALFSFTDEVRYFAGRYYRAYFYFRGGKGITG